MGTNITGVPLIHAPLGPEGEVILWPKPHRGQPSAITYEAVETILSRSIDHLRVKSYGGLALALGYNRSMGARWLRKDAHPPSRAAVIRLMYLFCLHKQDPERWSGSDLFLIDWDNIHIYGIPYTQYGSINTTMEVYSRELRLTALFRSRTPWRKATNWPQFETVITWTVRYLRLKSLVGLGKAIDVPQPTVDGWIMPPKRGPSPLVLWKLAYLWVLHSDSPRTWSGAALRRVDWHNIHEYGVPYQPYRPYDDDEDTEAA